MSIVAVVPKNGVKYLSSRRKIPALYKYGQYYHHCDHSDYQLLF